MVHLDLIPAQAHLVAIVRIYVELTQTTAGWFEGHCPFHIDHARSLRIRLDREVHLFYCFACNASGDAVTFLQLARAIGYEEAVAAISTFRP